MILCSGRPTLCLPPSYCNTCQAHSCTALPLSSVHMPPGSSVLLCRVVSTLLTCLIPSMIATHHNQSAAQSSTFSSAAFMSHEMITALAGTHLAHASSSRQQLCLGRCILETSIWVGQLQDQSLLLLLKCHCGSGRSWQSRDRKGAQTTGRSSMGGRGCQAALVNQRLGKVAIHGEESEGRPDAVCQTARPGQPARIQTDATASPTSRVRGAMPRDAASAKLRLADGGCWLLRAWPPAWPASPPCLPCPSSCAACCPPGRHPCTDAERWRSAGSPGRWVT